MTVFNASRYEDKYILYYEYEETLENLPIMR